MFFDDPELMHSCLILRGYNLLFDCSTYCCEDHPDQHLIHFEKFLM